MTVTSNQPATSARRPGRPAGTVAESRQREQLLLAAAAHFARHGFEGASLRAIAREAGLAHGLIRHYFGAKDAFWQATADLLFEQLNAAVGAALAQVDMNDPVARFQAQVRAVVHNSARIPHLAGFVMQAGLTGGPRYDWLVERHLRPAYQFSLQPLHVLRQQGRAADLDPHFVFILATNAAIGPFAQGANSRALAGVDLTDEKTADAYADVLIATLEQGVLRG